MNQEMRNRPRRSAFDRRYRLHEPVRPNISVRLDHDLGFADLDRRRERCALAPWTIRRRCLDYLPVGAALGVEALSVLPSSLAVRAARPEWNDYSDGQGERIRSGSFSGSSETKCSRNQALTASGPSRSNSCPYWRQCAPVPSGRSVAL